MSRSWRYCCLLGLIHAFNLTQASVHRIQYLGESVESDARAIARCVKRVRIALFEPSNRMVLIVSKNLLTGDSSLTDNILRDLSVNMNTVNVGSDFVFEEESLNPRRYRLNRDSSYLIMENCSENLVQLFLSPGLSIWAEYLIVTTIDVDTLNTFAGSLRERGFLRFAFLRIEEDISKVSTLYDTKMKVLMTFEANSGCGMMNNSTDQIRAFSSFLCPGKSCHITVGLIRNDMVGSRQVEEGRKVLNTGDHVVSFFVNKLTIEWKNRSLSNWTEALDAIVHDKVDVIYGCFIPRTEGLELLDVATWYGFEKVMFFDLVNIITVAPLTKIFSPLDIYVWLCTLGCLVAYWLFALVVQKAHDRGMINETIKVFNVWAILLGQGVRNPYNMGLRTVLSMWMITTLLINAAYGSAFKSSLASFERYMPIRTLDDVKRSGRRVVGTAVAGQLLWNTNDQNDRFFDEKFRLVPSEEVFSVAIKDNDVGVDYDINVKVHNIVERRRRTRLYTVKEPILVFPINFYLKKRHPYLKAFRQVVTRAKAAGLIQKWHVDDLLNIRYRIRRSLHRFRRRGPTRLHHWSVSFKLWGTGNSIAFIRFFYELYKSRKDRLKKMPKGKSKVDPINYFKIAEDLRKI